MKIKSVGGRGRPASIDLDAALDTLRGEGLDKALQCIRKGSSGYRDESILGSDVVRPDWQRSALADIRAIRRGEIVPTRDVVNDIKDAVRIANKLQSPRQSTRDKAVDELAFEGVKSQLFRFEENTTLSPRERKYLRQIKEYLDVGSNAPSARRGKYLQSRQFQPLSQRLSGVSSKRRRKGSKVDISITQLKEMIKEAAETVRYGSAVAWAENDVKKKTGKNVNLSPREALLYIITTKAEAAARGV